MHCRQLAYVENLLDRISNARTARERYEFCRELPALNWKQRKVCREFFDLFVAVYNAARNTLGTLLYIHV